MKFYTSVILMLFAVKCLEGQTLIRYADDDTQPLILKINNIKRIQCFKYKITGKGRIDSSLSYISNVTYSNTGSVNEYITNNKTNISMFDATTYNGSQAIVKHEIKINKGAKLDHGLTEENEFDNRGRLTHTVIYNQDTTFITRFERMYDTSGHWIKTLYKNESRLPIINMKTFKLQDSLFYDPDDRINHIQYYDSFGKKAALYLYNYEGTEEKTITVFEQRDDIQHLISQKKYNKSGLLIESMQSHNPFNVFQEEEKITINKLYYNKDGTINTSLGYYNNKLIYMYKFFYE